MKYEKEELNQLINEEKLSYEAIGRLYGVTGNAIKKAASKLGVKLPVRRKVQDFENFSHNVKSKINKFSHSIKSKVDNFTDVEFKQIILSSFGWKDIGEKLGYSNRPSSNVRDRIIERCSKLGIEPILYKPLSVLSRTKGELLNDRKNYQSYRSAIRKIADYVYKSSGKPYQCAICGYSNHIEIAHIKAVSDFENSTTIAEINSIDNLIALCPNHHWEYDHGILKL